MKITIERQANKQNDKERLRLVYWYGSKTVIEDGKPKIKHTRKREALNLFLYKKPQNVIERNHNKETLALAEAIRAKRIVEAARGEHDLSRPTEKDGRFYALFDELMESKRNTDSNSNYRNWRSARKHLKLYAPDESITFKSIDAAWLEGFQSYLAEAGLKNETQRAHYGKVRETLRRATHKGLVRLNPAAGVKPIKKVKKQHVYLDIEEVRQMATTPCKSELLKSAFLFSALTGLRWSDIFKLDWRDVSVLNGTRRIVFHHRKTEKLQYLDITEQASRLMGEVKTSGRVFDGLKYNPYVTVWLRHWALQAGIAKEITFHTGRHTFAVSLLSRGVDLYTVSKLLGHSEVKTTQIYADIVDQVRRDAVHKIPDIGL